MENGLAKPWDIIVGTEETRLRLLENTVQTYPVEWIIIHEVLQNAKDAIQKSTLEEGLIDVEFNLLEERVTVSDNGIGFPYKLGLLGIGGTDKKDEDWMVAGKIGVGLKAVLFSTKQFWLDAVHNKYKWSMKIDDAYKYLRREEGKLIVNKPSQSDDDSHTNVSYAFPENIVSDFFNMIWVEYALKVSDELSKSRLDKFKIAVEYYFRNYSYAGDINRLLELAGIKKIKINITVLIADACSEKLEPDLWETIKELDRIDIDFENKFWDIEEALMRIPRGVPKPSTFNIDIPDGGKIGDFSNKYIYVAKFTEKDDYKKLLKNKLLRDEPDTSSYDTFFEQLRGVYVVIGSIPQFQIPYLENQARFISANGVRSSHILRTPTRGGEYTLNNTIHCIINVDAKLTYGKQSIPNRWIIGMANKFYEDAYRSTLKNIAKNIVGRPPEGITTGDEITREPERVENIVGRPDIGLGDFSILKEPVNEDTTVAILYELIGKGYLEGYRTYHLSRTGRYDAKMSLKMEGEEEWRIPSNDSDLHTVEFKLRTSRLISDFEEGYKLPQDIQLIVVWENDFDESPDYQVVDIQYTDDADRRLPGVKYCLQSRRTGRLIQMLILKDIIQELT